MKKQLLSIIFIAALAFGVSAQKVVQPKPDLTIERLRKHITYLSSDKLEGRNTGEKGAVYAAGYVANSFSALKLKAGFVSGKRRSYLQPFPFVASVEVAKTGSEFKLDLTKADGSHIKFENLLPVKPVGFSINGEVADAEVVFAGFGIVSDELKYNDYNNLDVRNKVVIVFDGTPENGNPQSQFLRFADVRLKAKLAKDKGAKGLLIISSEEKFENERLASLKYDQTLGESAIPAIVVSRNTAANMLGGDEAKLKQLEGLWSMKKDPTVKVNFSILTKDIVSFKVNLVKKTAEAYNVIGVLEGTDPILKNEAIIIGGHYDHLGKGGHAGSLAPNSTEVHHGADDNASGTSAVIELARQFSQTKTNKRTLIFIAFSGEEEGLIGSKFYVNNPVFPLDKTVAMINMDMIGRLREGKLTVGGIGTASEWKDLIEGKNPSSGLAMTSATTGSQPITTSIRIFKLQLSEDGFGPSDHSSFYGKQIPVLFFFTGSHEDYHKPSDTVDKINFNGLSQVMSYVYEIAKAIDANPKRPTYTVAKSSGTQGRGTFKVSLGVVPGYGETNDGLVLDGVRDNSAAAKAGLKAGDKVIKLAGKDVRNVSDYTIILGELKADVEIEIVVMRGTEKLTLKITPAARK
jgi:aminopeptidase YwaD